MKIAYSSLPVKPDAAFPQRTAIDHPIVALLLQKGDLAVVAYALADSGANSCVFPASVAASLGIEIPNARRSIFSGTLSEPQAAYYEEIQVTILPLESPEIETEQEPVTFSLYAGFCETLEHVGMGLLGQEGFFSRFAVKFHAAKRYFEILPEL